VTLLLRMVVELLAAAVAWLVALALVSTAVGLAASAALRRRFDRRLLLWSFGGAAVTMALAHRLRIPDPVALEVWRRDLLIMWSAIGAAAGSALAVLSSWGRSRDAPGSGGRAPRRVADTHDPPERR
jgi:hypothetical protein